jgi:hypothetical protein
MLDRQREIFEGAVDSNGDGVAFQSRADAARDGAAVDRFGE